MRYLLVVFFIVNAAQAATFSEWYTSISRLFGVGETNKTLKIYSMTKAISTSTAITENIGSGFSSCSNVGGSTDLGVVCNFAAGAFTEQPTCIVGCHDSLSFPTFACQSPYGGTFNIQYSVNGTTSVQINGWADYGSGTQPAITGLRIICWGV